MNEYYHMMISIKDLQKFAKTYNSFYLNFGGQNSVNVPKLIKAPHNMEQLLNEKEYFEKNIISIYFEHKGIENGKKKIMFETKSEKYKILGQFVD